MVMYSGVVPSIGTEGKVFFSDSTVLVEVAIGATAAVSFMSAIALTSDKERLDCSKVLDEVSSLTILVMEFLLELGRTTMRSEPMDSASDLMRLEILPIRERIRMMLATPMAMPRQVRKERVRFSLMDVLASLK